MAGAPTSIGTSRWAFLSPHFSTWFRASAYGDRDVGAPAPRGLQFDSFHVYVPPDPSALPALRHATVLVALMLQRDARAWWFVLDEFTPWFHSFRPSEYDAATLVPRMTFVLHERFSTRDDPPGAVGTLHQLLLGEPCEEAAPAFCAARSRVLAMAAAHEMEDPTARGRVAIAVQLTPAASELRACLVDTIAMVRAVEQRRSRAGDYPFTLEEIRLRVYVTRQLCEAQDLLRELFSMTVPVTVKLRRVDHEDETLAGLAPGEIYKALTGGGGAAITLHHREVFSTVELWSAVACSTILKTLIVDQQFRENGAERCEHAKWLAYALRMSPSLQSLVLTMYEPTEHEFQLTRTMAEAINPARLLGSTDYNHLTSDDDSPRYIKLRANAEIALRDGSIHTREALGITDQSSLSLVNRDTRIDQVQFIVPGHGICSASLSDVISCGVVKLPPQYGLTSLTVYSDEERSGVASEFVDVFGKRLHHFNWTGEPSLLHDDVSDFDVDLQAILLSSRHLQTLSLQYRKLRTVDALVDMHSTSRLRSLSLVNVPVSAPELIRLFQTLADPTAQISRTMEELQYRCEDHPVPVAAMEAALVMLRSNRRLTHVRFGVQTTTQAEYHRNFGAQNGILVMHMPLRVKLAFLSVVEQDVGPLGQLDASCVSMIWSFISKPIERQVELVCV